MPEKRKTIRHFNDPGHAHFLTFSCYQRLPLLKSNRTIRWFMDALSTAQASHSFQTMAYVIMTEHAHLIIHPLAQVYDTGAILKSIKQPVSRKAKLFLEQHNSTWLKKLSVTRGKREVFRFWQTGPGYDRNIRDEEDLLEKMNYIHLNPVRSGLASSPEEWEWSSAKEYQNRNREVANAWTEYREIVG